MSSRLPPSLPARLTWWAGLVLAAGTADADDPTVRFNRDIRPILSENCYHCHGPDEEARVAGLRLDREEGAKEYAVVSGDSDASELVARIESEDPEARMPPPDSERALTQEQIALLRRWIDEGASFEGHWSFATPTFAAPPRSRFAGAGAIDDFIRGRLESFGLTPAPPADREVLIRRVTFDVTGLPPTTDEIDAFIADQSPHAYSDLIDRLMARPEFGQRMASDWLDAARYSDTYGYQVDRDRFVWPWRDWVVRAFNDNLPYDRFLTEQLAGDLLPGASRDQILATTFNRLHPQKVEGGSVPEEFRIEYVADRTQTVATAMLGLTYECCRCHHHKYDPIRQDEYYQLSAFFDNIDEAGLYSFFTSSVPTPTLALPSDSEQAAMRRADQEVAAAEAALARVRSERQSHWSANEKSDASSLPITAVANPIASVDFEATPENANESIDGVRGKAYRLTGDDPVETQVGNFPRWQPFSISLWIRVPDHKERAVVLHRSRAWTDAGSRGYELLIDEGRLAWSLIHFWPGNSVRIRTTEEFPLGRWTHVAVTYDGSSRAEGLRIFVDGQPSATDVIRDHLTRHITGGGGDHLTVGERFRDRGLKGGGVDELHVYDVELTSWEIERLSALITPGQSSATQRAVTSDHVRRVEHFLQRVDDQMARRRADLLRARERRDKLADSIDEIMVMRELPRPRPTFLLGRGAYDSPLREVHPGTPEALLPFPADAPRNRLGLARWMCDPRHPLTGRVAVNRLWQVCFGNGLVRTPEDFGSQGTPPTHPELLDWLAVEFVEGGWDVKRMLKQILMSHTYRQSSSHPDPKIASVDPDNRWLARFPSYRLPAEMLRDSALAVGGRLVRIMGGPPVKPYEVEASFKPSDRDQGSGLYRRSLYTYWKRTGPAPAMMTLDASKRDVCRVQRERTSSPLQAFVMLNGPQYVEAARGLAESLLREALRDGSPDVTDAMLRRAFRTVTSLTPSDPQLALLSKLYASQQLHFEADRDRAEAFLSVGDGARDQSLDSAKLAAMTVVIGTLMNFDPSVVKR